MQRFSLVFLALVGVCAPAEAKFRFGGLPAPIAAYARDLQLECVAAGQGDLVASDDFGLAAIAAHELNGDGAADYFVYRCYFGCSGNREFFLGKAGSCGWGDLLMSSDEGTKRLFVPGMMNRVLGTDPLRVVVTRPRSLRLIGNFCSNGFADHDPQYIYELKDGRFQAAGNCGEMNCRDPSEKPQSVLPQID